MQSQLLFAVLGSVALLCVVVFAWLLAERRKESRQQRLQAVIATAPIAEILALPLRRPVRQGGAGGYLAGLRARLEAALAATGNSIAVPHLILAGVIAAVVVAGLGTRLIGFNPAATTLLAAAAAVAAPALLLRLAQSRYQRRFLDVFPDALDLLGRAVTAGLPVVDAMEVAAREIRPPVGIEFQRTLDEMRIGVEQADALEHTAERVRVPDFRFYIVALALQRRTGGSLAETLGNLSNIIRRRKEIRLKTRALTAESRTSATVLAVIPFVFMAGLSVINPGLFSTLLGDPRGRFMLALALIGIVIGIAVMFWMIHRALR